MNIVVLCGGLSAERDVSLSSGAMAAAALKRLGHRVVLMDLFFGYQGEYGDPREVFLRDDAAEAAAIGEDAPDLEAVRKSRGDGGRSRMGKNVLEVCAAADIVFMALHGADGEDGKVQAAFDLCGIRYTGTGPLGSGVAMNKAVAKTMLRDGGVRTPEGIALERCAADYPTLCFPCVVKPCSGGSSVGTHVVYEESEYLPALEDAFRYDEKVLVERYVKGREVDVGVIDGHALPPIEICPVGGFYDYKNKYQKGMAEEICPADFPEEITEKLKAAAVSAYGALLFEVYGRMDFIVDEAGDVWCLEGNTLPGLTPTSLLPQEAAAEGISYDGLCQKIIELSLKKYGE